MLGIAGAGDFNEYGKILEARAEEGLVTVFEEKEIARRLHPERWLSGARSIISLAVPYLLARGEKQDEGHGKKQNKRQGKTEFSRGALPGCIRGYVSRFARGADYHRVLKLKLEAILDFLKKESPGSFSYLFFVDTGPPLERAVAVRAGLGWFGANCSLINPKYGSWVFLGEIVTDLDLKPDEPLKQNCHNCRLCLDACPTGALTEPGKINPWRCLSYWTQSGGYLPRDMRKMLGNRLYGCDDCQLVCPVNKRAEYSNDEAFFPVFEEEGLPLIPLLKMSNKRFKHVFGETAAGWRGKEIIQRNAIVIMGNKKNPEAEGILAQLLLEDFRPKIRGHAAWSMGELDTRYARLCLRKAYEREDDPIVREEIEGAIDGNLEIRSNI